MRRTARIAALALLSLLPALLTAAPKAPPHKVPLHRAQGVQSPKALSVPAEGIGTCTPMDGPGWSATGSMRSPRAFFTATLLQNAKVLVAGGYDEITVLSTCEIYDPITGTWSWTGNLNEARRGATATLLRTGKVLVVGGDDGNATSLSSTEIFDPELGTWTQLTGAGSHLLEERTWHTATLLLDGRVLVVGGYGNTATLNSAEIYDPGIGMWTTTDHMATARGSHTATLLPDGTVLVVGGDNSDSDSLASAEIYTPNGTPDRWTATGSLADGDRANHTATLLPSGEVLVAGGYGCVDRTGTVCNRSGELLTAQLYDYGAKTWSDTGSMNVARSYHTATLLPNGKVLAVGGVNATGQLNSADIFDPADDSWNPGGSLADSRRCHVATSLPSGVVLVEGGEYSVDVASAVRSSAEIYAPDPGMDTRLQPDLESVTSLVCLGVTQVIATGTNFQGLSECSGGNGGQNSSTNYPLLQIHAVDEKDYYLLSDPVRNPVDQSYGWSSTHFRSVMVASGAIPVGAAEVRIIANGVASDPISVTIGPRTPTVGGASSNICPALSVELTTESGMADYQWYKDAGSIVGATVASYTATESGTYTVSYSDGCGTGTSVGKVVTIAACLAPPETAPGDTPAKAQSWPDKQTIAWPVNEGATSGYHLYRGVQADLPSLLSSGTDSCTRATTPDASLNSATGIAEDPSGVAGRFYWYLVTGLNWTEGSPGNATTGERIVNSSGDCP